MRYDADCDGVMRDVEWCGVDRGGKCVVCNVMFG